MGSGVVGDGGTGWCCWWKLNTSLIPFIDAYSVLSSTLIWQSSVGSKSWGKSCSRVPLTSRTKRVVGYLSMFYGHSLFTANLDTRVTRLIDPLCFVIFATYRDLLCVSRVSGCPPKRTNIMGLSRFFSFEDLVCDRFSQGQ